MNDDGLLQRLLILDDDKAIATTICAVADGIGFETRATHRATAFFEALEQWEPSHVMVDLVMPDKDGVEVVVELAERGFEGQLIIVSGLGGRSLGLAGRMASEYGLNFAGVLPKPFAPSVLRALLTADPEQKQDKPCFP